jgi:hypothetical protein
MLIFFIKNPITKQDNIETIHIIPRTNLFVCLKSSAHIGKKKQPKTSDANIPIGDFAFIKRTAIDREKCTKLDTENNVTIVVILNINYNT